MQMQTVEQVKKRIDYLLERDQATEAEIEKVYNEAVDTLRAIVSDVHNRYAVDGVVVPANLYGKVTVKDMLLLKQQYDKLPDDLSAQEQDRVDYYTAMSQTSPRGLITALVGMALIGVTHKVGKIIAKNNRTAVKEEIAYQVENENVPKLNKKKVIKKYSDPNFKAKSIEKSNFIPWLDRLWLNHDQMLNRIDNSINQMIANGMNAEEIANKLFPGTADSMRRDNIPKVLHDASVRAKRIARTTAAALEDEITEQIFKEKGVKYYDWVTEPGACMICIKRAFSGPYKVDGKSSPRVPVDSHPNCRCRRTQSELELELRSTGKFSERQMKKRLRKREKERRRKEYQRDKQAGYKPQLEPPNIQENFAKGIWKDEINKHAQKRHQNKDVPHTPQDGKSRTLFNNDIDVELLYNEFKGRGEFEQSTDGKYVPRESVDVGMVVAIDNKGRRLTGIKIHYSSTGVHLVPWKGDSNDFK